MTYVPVAAAAAASAARARMMTQEEEPIGHLVGYGPSWEFKIVRSAFAAFRRRSEFAKLLAQEALAGWQLVEKLDDSRIRFARPVRERAHDGGRAIDPYRVWYGVSAVKLVWILVAIIFGVMLVPVLVVLLTTGP